MEEAMNSHRTWVSLTSAAWKTARKLQDDFKMGTVEIGYEKRRKNEL